MDVLLLFFPQGAPPRDPLPSSDSSTWCRSLPSELSSPHPSPHGGSKVGKLAGGLDIVCLSAHPLSNMCVKLLAVLPTTLCLPSKSFIHPEGVLWGPVAQPLPSRNTKSNKLEQTALGHPERNHTGCKLPLSRRGPEASLTLQFPGSCGLTSQTTFPNLAVLPVT